MIPSTLAGLLLALVPLASAAARPKNAVLLSEVQSLTLRGNGAQTSHRRVPAMPQLKCVSSKALCDLYDIDVMRCTNQGSSYGDEDIEWSCTASLPEELKLGSTDVLCEGYSSPDDPYVLKGSCGVEYRLLLTKKGEARYPDVSRGIGNGEFAGSSGAVIFSIIFVAVLAWIVYSACIAVQDPNRPRTRPRGGNNGGGPGGGGGGGGGWNPGWGPDNDDPPPPYYSSSKPSSSRQQGWRPGFWSGLAGGTAAGYMAGNRSRNRNDAPRRGYGSNWGGGGGWGAGPSTGGTSSPSSGSRHESTGFGSTNRR